MLRSIISTIPGQSQESATRLQPHNNTPLTTTRHVLTVTTTSHHFSTTKNMTTMHAALVTKFGQPPVYTEIPKPEPPLASSDLVHIKVLYAGVHQVVRSRASGQHYSVKSSPDQPVHLVPGIDGVGTISTGEYVYFITVQPVP